MVHGLDGAAADVASGLADSPGPEPGAGPDGGSHVEGGAQDGDVRGKALELNGVSDVGELEEGREAHERGFGVEGGSGSHG